MGKKKKSSSPSRQSARILAKKQVLDGSSKAPSGKNLNEEVDLASSSSSFEREDASSTSSKEFKEVFEALESGCTYKDHIKAQNRAKAELVCSLTHKSRSRSPPTPCSRMGSSHCSTEMDLEASTELEFEPSKKENSIACEISAKKEDGKNEQSLPDGPRALHGPVNRLMSENVEPFTVHAAMLWPHPTTF